MKNFEVQKHDKYEFLSVHPIPSKSELSKFYEEEYYQKDTGQYHKQYSNVELEYFVSDCRVLIELYSKIFPKSTKNSLLDVGCGEGYQANYFFEKNWDIQCIDYADFGIKHHHPHLLKYLLKGEIEETLRLLGQKEQKYAVIFLKNVLEHVLSPVILLGHIKKLMDNETLLCINVPNDYSAFQTHLVKNGYTQNTWFCPPVHLHYFQFDSIRKILEGEGFEIVSLQAGFPIEQFLVNASSNYAKNKSVGKSAHLSRCEISNFLLSQGIDKFIKLREAYAELSFGRDIIATVKLKV